MFNAPPIHDLNNNLHHRLQLPGFVIAVAVGALISVVITYVIAVRWSSQITYFVMRRIPHEAVLTLFMVFILLLAYIDAGVPNMFGVLLVGVVCGAASSPLLMRPSLSHVLCSMLSLPSPTNNCST